MNKNITCIILSGGKSSRMGENKSFLNFGEKTVIEHIIQLMKSIFSDVILITNTPHEYQHLAIPIFEDVYKQMGPLAGMHSGLVNSKTEQNFIISCDLPLMSREVIDHIINYKTNKKITICKADGYLQPLLGIYLKSLIPIIENILTNEKKHSMYALLDRVNSEIIEINKLAFYNENVFLNMNRPEDYENILSKINLLSK